MRPSWVEVDLDAVTHNVRLIADEVAPAKLCAVVKADGYGHAGGSAHQPNAGAKEVAYPAQDPNFLGAVIRYVGQGCHRALRIHKFTSKNS